MPGPHLVPGDTCHEDLPLSASTALGALARPTVIALDYVRGVDGAPAQYRPLLP